MQIIANKLKANCILLDQSNKYCYGTSLGSDIIMVWRFDPATGTLSPKGAGRSSYQNPARGLGICHSTLMGASFILITATTDTIGLCDRSDISDAEGVAIR
jgi:hypothetical protein